MSVPWGALYRFPAAQEARGIQPLFDVSHRKPNLKNRMDKVTGDTVVRFATDCPVYGQICASNELRKGERLRSGANCVIT